MMDKVLCCDVGGTFLKLGLSEGPDHCIETGRVTTPTDWDAFAEAIRNALAVHDASRVALSVAGVIDAAGRVLSANVPAIAGRGLAGDLSRHLGRPVTVANDADCLTLAEAHAGAGRGHDVVFCVILGTGVGGGLAVGGRTVPGAGEWGHGPVVNGCVTIDGEARLLPRLPCGCGRTGCVDTIGAARGIERLHRLLGAEAADSAAIVTGWQAAEPVATRTVTAWLDLVADPLAVVVNATGASIVPVGGGLAGATALIAALDAAVRTRVLNPPAGALVVPAQRREDGGLVGAAIVARTT